MYLVSAGELFLKGKNINMFENQLVRNIISELGLKKGELVNKRFRYLIKRGEDPGIGKVFGISNYAKVVECDFSEIGDVAVSLLGKAKSFRVTAKRSTKEFKSSDKIQKEIGAYIVEKTGLKVNLVNFDVEVFVDILDGKAYLYTEKIKGLGGLPVGVTGDVFIDIKDPIKRKVAEFLMKKRGCNIKKKADVVVKDLDLKDIKKEEGLVLYPLLGYADKEIKNIYLRIRR